MDLHELTISSAKDLLSSKQVSSVELTKACLENIRTQDENLNAMITVTSEHALQEAEKADKLASQGEALHNKPLLGIPIAIKDNFSTKDILTTAGSNVLNDYVPPFDATVVTKLKQAGAVIIGKANMDSWAHGSSGENSDYGITKNPWNTEYIPGGSSSGSAVSVASNYALAATGTDTGGSIRLPASFNNVVGLKPTYGLVSRYGVIAMASSLDSIGHITKTVEDSALFLQVTAGNDPMDATSTQKKVPDYVKSVKEEISGLKIGIDPDFFSEEIDSESAHLLSEALSILKNKINLNIVDSISLPHQKYGIESYYVIQPAEVSSNLARYDGIRFGNSRSAFGQEAKRRIMLGTYVLSAGYYDAYYKKAMQVRTLIKQDFDKVFKTVDAMIAPVSPTPPWKIGEKTNDPIKMYLSDKFTVTANLAGIPALTIPIGFTKNNLPVGMQILGPHFSEETLFKIGHAYEKETQFWKQRPPLVSS